MAGEHVLVVNGGKVEPVELLRQDRGLRISMITEPGHRHLYPDLEHVTTVDDIGDLKQVRTAALGVIAARGPVDAVVAPSERSLPTGGYLRSYLGLPGLPFDTANLFCNKYAMKARLRAHGVPVAAGALAPTVAELPAAARATGLPVVVKPAFGNGTAFTHRVADAAELTGAPLRASLDRAPGPFVVEEYLDVADEYHCDALVVDGTVVFASVSRYFQPVLRSLGALFGSHTVPEEAPEVPVVRSLNERTVAALGLRDGVTHLEVLRTTDSRFLVGEIACRPGGGGVPHVLARKYGIDTRGLFLTSALGRPLDHEVRTADGVHYWCVLPVRHGTVAEVSTADDFRDLPGVLHVEMAVAPGDTVAGTLYSTSMAGLIVGRTDRVDEIPGLLDRIRRRFTIRIEDGPVRPGRPTAGAARP
ncbi:hypothetical protein ACFVHB_30735 [Kitasatospora sp. NPDC127111]|uniref:hypothetical protein n=1 Tax=Kitasatospora sp. NPDC127111 TaxID=3345363 RepID=UPI003635639F